jgi:hypothetical protein
MKLKQRLILVIFMLLVTTIACAGTVQSLRVDGLPQYICPSSTPQPTHTQPPTSDPIYLPYFVSNLSWHQVAPNFNVILAQWNGQSAGTVYASYSGSMNTYPYYWTGSSGYIPVSTIPGPTQQGVYAIVIPLDVVAVTISVYASGVSDSMQYYSVVRVFYDIYPTLIPPPSDAPGSITPTPRPTYTPWPTPTEYVRTNDYFVGDAIYTPEQPSGLRLRFRVTNIRQVDTAERDKQGQFQSIFIWDFEVKNIGSVEYDLFPAGQMYVSTITLPSGLEQNGVWGASLAAAEEAGLTPNYDLTDIQPDETKTFTLAAYGPRGTARRISYILDVTERDDGISTLVPGQNIVSWINEVNTICTGEIEEP